MSVVILVRNRMDQRDMRSWWRNRDCIILGFNYSLEKVVFTCFCRCIFIHIFYVLLTDFELFTDFLHIHELLIKRFFRCIYNLTLRIGSKIGNFLLQLASLFDLAQSFQLLIQGNYCHRPLQTLIFLTKNGLKMFALNRQCSTCLGDTLHCH